MGNRRGKNSSCPDDERHFSDIDELNELGGFSDWEEDSPEDESATEEVEKYVALTSEQIATIDALDDACEEVSHEDDYYDYYSPDSIRGINRHDFDAIMKMASDCVVLIEKKIMGDSELTKKIFLYEDLLTVIASETDIRVEVICLKAEILTPQEMRRLVFKKAKKKK